MAAGDCAGAVETIGVELGDAVDLGATDARAVGELDSSVDVVGDPPPHAAKTSARQPTAIAVLMARRYGRQPAAGLRSSGAREYLLGDRQSTAGAGYPLDRSAAERSRLHALCESEVMPGGDAVGAAWQLLVRLVRSDPRSASPARVLPPVGPSIPDVSVDDDRIARSSEPVHLERNRTSVHISESSVARNRPGGRVPRRCTRDGRMPGSCGGRTGTGRLRPWAPASSLSCWRARSSSATSGIRPSASRGSSRAADRAQHSQGTSTRALHDALTDSHAAGEEMAAAILSQ